ncbi:CDP-glycerol glycerophosphotransferase family protein [Bacillus sp. USDA818B3_A]|uniref:CDP-glycerol glycerophosphotransferase family protein n=1 Tax=Bacillus sp. USDA818B3_A TaxID=2698834 RepID=UPI0013714C16|nr:CDP-glycerol glycerophosphotransferase family protein [Bacillus sp. USDA818B3_A]
MRKLLLSDIDIKNGNFTGSIKVNKNHCLKSEIKVTLVHKTLKERKVIEAKITKLNKEELYFSLPLHTIDFPNPRNNVEILNIYVSLSNNENYMLVPQSNTLRNKITYSLPYQVPNGNQLHFFIKGSQLALAYGNPLKIYQGLKKEKTIIRDVELNLLDNTLSFFIIAPAMQTSQLVLVERGSKTEWHPDAATTTIDGKQQIKINLNSFIKAYYNQPSRWDFFIETTNNFGISGRSQLGLFDQEPVSKYKRYLDSIPTEGIHVVTPYITEKNGFALVIREPFHLANEKLESHLKVIRFHMVDKIIEGTLNLQLPNVSSFTVKSLVLKYRSKTEPIQYNFPISDEKVSQTKSIIKFSIDISSLELQNYYWDFYLLVNVNHNDYMIRLNNPAGNVRSHLNKKSIRQSYIYDNGYWVYPYITAANTIALLYKEKEVYETSFNYFKETLAYYIYILFKWYFDKRNIWLGFEKFADSAQDNGFYFFQYCYQKGKKKDFYYIIKKDSPDYHNLESMNDKVIQYMSFKYMIYLFAAKLLISSESKGHVYDIRTQKGLLKRSINQKRQVFLQHGVIGLKRVDQVFKKTSNNAVDLFVVSSEHEKEIIKKNFGYKDEEIIITGLSRWDVLFDQSGGQSTILLMPTWRSWMDDLPEEKFVTTEYYKQYFSLLNSPDLKGILTQHNIYLNFFIHPKFKEYIKQFTSNNNRIKIYQFGEIQLNKLLMRSSLLVTDYSSVSWDMYYQKKPVIFFQFDLSEYVKYQGSYIDLERDLFGDGAYTAEQLISLIKSYAERNFQEKEKYAQLRTKYFKFTDHNNSNRIYQEILKNAERLNKKKRGMFLLDSSLIRTLWTLSKKNPVLFKAANRIKNILTDIK